MDKTRIISAYYNVVSLSGSRVGMMAQRPSNGAAMRNSVVINLEMKTF